MLRVAQTITMDPATIFKKNMCVLLKSVWSVWQGRSKAPANSKGSFNSSLKQKKANVWSEKTPRQSKQTQNSRLTFKPLSSVNAKPQTALLLGSHPLLYPVTPFLNTKGGFLLKKQGLKQAAKSSQPHTPSEADIPRTSTSSPAEVWVPHQKQVQALQQ